MRHLSKSVHLNRSTSHRRALFANLSAQLFIHKRITTTLAKAKYTRQYAERLITFARRGTLADRRHVLKFIIHKDVVKTLFDELGVHFKNRDGGYTRIIKLGSRKGDNAPMAILELVGFDDISLEAPKTKGTSRLKASQTKAVDEKVTQAEVSTAEKAEVVETDVKDSATPAESADSADTEATETDKSEEADKTPEASKPSEADKPEDTESDKKD